MIYRDRLGTQGNILYEVLRDAIYEKFSEEFCSECRYNTDGWTCRAEFDPEDGDCPMSPEWDTWCNLLVDVAGMIYGRR